MLTKYIKERNFVNIIVIVVELLIMFAVFLFLVIGMLLINPVTFISDYPPEIQEEYSHDGRRI